MKRGKRKVAVFDIDGTIFRSSLLIELVEGLIIAGVFPKKARAVYEEPKKRWLNRKSGYEQYIRAVIKAFDSQIAGVKESDFLPVARHVVRFHKDRVYRYTRGLVRKLKRAGYYLLAVSHSPKYVVDRFARELGFDKVYGRLLQLGDDGRFTGEGLFLELIFDKAAIFRRAVEKGNLTLRGSIGVGDTESDIPFLKLVEHPICFNPNQALFSEAKRRKWKVVVERKDVIYEHMV